MYLPFLLIPDSSMSLHKVQSGIFALNNYLGTVDERKGKSTLFFSKNDQELRDTCTVMFFS